VYEKTDQSTHTIAGCTEARWPRALGGALSGDCDPAYPSEPGCRGAARPSTSYARRDGCRRPPASRDHAAAAIARARRAQWPGTMATAGWQPAPAARLSDAEPPEMGPPVINAPGKTGACSDVISAPGKTGACSGVNSSSSRPSGVDGSAETRWAAGSRRRSSVAGDDALESCRRSRRPCCG
jgi:hypothetical protein